MLRSKIINVLLISACLIPVTLHPAACKKVTGSPKNILTDHQITTIIKNYLAPFPPGIGIAAIDPATKDGKRHYLEVIVTELATNGISLQNLPHLKTVLKKHHKQSTDRDYAIWLLNNTICVLK